MIDNTGRIGTGMQSGMRLVMFDRRPCWRLRLINYCGCSTPRVTVEGPSGGVATLEHSLTSGILTSSLLRDPSDQYLCGCNTRKCLRINWRVSLLYAAARVPFSSLFNLFRVEGASSSPSSIVLHAAPDTTRKNKSAPRRTLDENFDENLERETRPENFGNGRVPISFKFGANATSLPGRKKGEI